MKTFLLSIIWLVVIGLSVWVLSFAVYGQDIEFKNYPEMPLPEFEKQFYENCPEMPLPELGIIYAEPAEEWHIVPDENINSVTKEGNIASTPTPIYTPDIKSLHPYWTPKFNPSDKVKLDEDIPDSKYKTIVIDLDKDDIVEIKNNKVIIKILVNKESKHPILYNYMPNIEENEYWVEIPMAKNIFGNISEVTRESKNYEFY